MAEKVIAISMELDTSQTVSGLNEVESGVKKVDNSVNNLNADAKKLTLGEQIQKINDEVKSGELGFRQLRKKIQEYQTIAIAAGRTSPVGKEALQQAAVLRDQLDDLDKEVKNLAADGQALQGALQLGQGVVAGFTAFKGVTAALGIENENLMKVMTQLQGLQAAMMGLERLHTLLRKESTLVLMINSTATKAAAAAQAAYSAVIGTSTGMLKAFKLALAATGIGAIIVGVGLLITNFDLLKKGVANVVEWFSQMGEHVFRLIEYYNELGIVGKAVLWILAAPIMLAIEAYQFFFGEVEKGTADMMASERKAAEERKRQTKELANAHKERVKQINSERDAIISAADDTIKALKLEKDTLEAQGLASDASALKILEAEKTKLEAVLSANSQKIQSYIKLYTDLAALRGEDEATFKKSMLAQGVDLEMLQEKANKLLQDNEDAIQYSENKITKFKREQGEKRAKEAEAIQKDLLAKQQEANDQYLALEDELTKLLLANMEDGAEKELAILADKQGRERDMLINKHGENLELLKQLDIKHEQELLKLQAKFDKDRLAQQEKLIDLQIANLKEGDDKEFALLKEKHRRELAEIEGNGAIETEMRKELLIQQEGALAELQATIDEQDKEEREAKIQEGMDKMQSFLDTAAEVNEMLNELGDRKIERIEADRDRTLSTLDQQKKAELSQAGLTANQKIAIENRFAAQEYATKLKAAEAADKIAERQFKRDKALKVAQIGMNTASAVMQALGSLPPPASFIVAGTSAAMGIAQAAIVSSQQYKSSAANIAPPSFSSPDLSGDSGSSGGSGSGGGGNGQTDTGTDLTNLPNVSNVPVVVSQVDINKTAATMVNIEEVSTLG